MLRNISMMELYMNAVERINHYATEVPTESDEGQVIPKDTWPAHGAITFQVHRTLLWNNKKIVQLRSTRQHYFA